MTTSKTYLMAAGLNYIQSSDIIYTSVYLVKREGTQYDKYISGDGNRRYIYTPSEGRIYFSTAANTGGEKVYVLFKKTSFITGPIPGVCETVVIEDSVMPNAVVGVSYSHAFPLSGTPPYVLNITNQPSWATVEISLFGVLTIMGFPDVPGSELLELSVTNCGGSVPLSKSFTTLPNSDNLFITSPSISRITNVTVIPYVITGGSYPVSATSSVYGIHNDYTGIITVTTGPIFFPRVLRLQRNGITLETKPVTTSGNYSFASQVYLSTDTINIILE